MSRCKLEEFISYEQPSKYIVDSDQYDDSFEIPVLTAGKSFILGYTDETNNIFDNLPVIIFDDFTTSVQFVDFPFKVKSSAMKLLKNTEQADIKYCYYLLKFLQHTPENHKRQWLSATSQNIVELPTIEKQKSIVRKLDKILEVIDNQNKQLKLLDEAIKARFVEMFGDPRINPINFNKSELKDTCDIITGNTPSRKNEEYYGDYIEWIKTDNIVVNKLNPTHAKESLSKEGMDVGRTVEKNCILMACIAGSISSIGRVCVTDRKVAFNQQINAIVPKKYNCMFLYVLMQVSKDYLVDGINMALKGILSKSRLEKKQFIVPPLELQNQFASFVEEIDKSRLLSNHLLFLIKSISSNY